MDYELVLVDADDTLFDYRKAVARALPALFARFGLPWDPDRDPARFRAANTQVWSEMRAGLISYADLKIERFRKMLPNESLDFQAVSHTYLSLLVEFAQLIDGAEEVCRYLASKYTLAIVTNGLPEIQKPRVRLSSLSRYIPEERVFVAEDVGHRKPDPEIFRHVFRALGHSDKKTAIIIGDSLAEDIQGGVNFGIDTCWFDRAGLDGPQDVRPTFTVRSLLEIVDILAKPA
ncbi:MAG: YjjG family noncanonical pyrimidine nucleotidase [Bacillota bacterium]